MIPNSFMERAATQWSPIVKSHSRKAMDASSPNSALRFVDIKQESNKLGGVIGWNENGETKAIT